MLAAMLCAQGILARDLCGFGTCFTMATGKIIGYVSTGTAARAGSWSMRNRGMMMAAVIDGSDEAWTMVDYAAELTLHTGDCFEELHCFYAQSPRLHVPEEWLYL
jgi:hypothetical protein